MQMVHSLPDTGRDDTIASDAFDRRVGRSGARFVTPDEPGLRKSRAVPGADAGWRRATGGEGAECSMADVGVICTCLINFRASHVTHQPSRQEARRVGKGWVQT